MPVTYKGGQQDNLKKQILLIYSVLKDKTAWDALTAAQQREILRKIALYVVRDKLKDELPE